MSFAAVRNFLTKSPVIIRIAGLSGAAAVSLGAYGAHGLRNKVTDEKRLRSYDQGSRYHLLHSLALLNAPLARYPILTASLFLAGMTIFCGNCYYYGLTGDRTFVRSTPVGGSTIIVAWLSFVL
uniref:Conserved plasma membrane protein n=1 Tax=Ascaris lumbricoides TaxID=6252 RepID=A0A0M3HS14_ASCLU